MRNRTVSNTVLLLLSIILLFVLNLLLGTVKIPVAEVVATLMGSHEVSEIHRNIIWSSMGAPGIDGDGGRGRTGGKWSADADGIPQSLGWSLCTGYLQWCLLRSCLCGIDVWFIGRSRFESSGVYR